MRADRPLGGRLSPLSLQCICLQEHPSASEAHRILCHLTPRTTLRFGRRFRCARRIDEPFSRSPFPGLTRTSERLQPAPATDGSTAVLQNQLLGGSTRVSPTSRAHCYQQFYAQQYQSQYQTRQQPRLRIRLQQQPFARSLLAHARRFTPRCLRTTSHEPPIVNFFQQQLLPLAHRPTAPEHTPARRRSTFA